VGAVSVQTIGNAHPGQITARIQALYKALIRRQRA